MAEKQFSFKFKDIAIIHKELVFAPNTVNTDSVFQFDIKIIPKVYESAQMIIWITEVNIKVENTDVHLAKFSVGCVFEIVDLPQLVSKDEKGAYIIPIEIDSIMKPVSISTTRGVIYSELRGTYLGAAIMPVVFMDSFKPIEQQAEEKGASIIPGQEI